MPDSHRNSLQIGGMHPADEIPRYTINLALPPAKRYQHIVRDYKHELAALPVLFDDIVKSLQTKLTVNTIRMLARLLLRRLHDGEQNEELQGIHRATGIEMYLLVAYNVLLDLFMGCTSGGIRVRRSGGTTRMLHFRTLDWGMDPLRKVVVHLNFVERADGPTVATSITYVGFVGVLTGVRQGLSISLNFRPNHDTSSRLANFRFYLHHILVLIGARPSISSILRSTLLPRQNQTLVSRPGHPTLAAVERRMPASVSTAAYLIFSDGERTVTMEKDHRTAVVKSANDIIAIANHDQAEDLAPQEKIGAHIESDTMLETTGVQALIEDSKTRKTCAMRLWRAFARGPQGDKSIPQHELIKWINKYPITNEETHFAAVMDATEGSVVWSKFYPEPAC